MNLKSENYVNVKIYALWFHDEPFVAFLLSDNFEESGFL